MSHFIHPFEIRRVGDQSILVCRNMETVKIGVLVPGRVQLLELACFDILHLMSKSHLASLGLSEALVDSAPNVEISYITSSPAGGSISASSNAQITATHSVKDAEVQPGKLDILLVLGSGTKGPWDQDILDFLRDHLADDSTDVLVGSTGVYLCGDAGVLRGKSVAGPRALQDDLKARYEGVDFVGDRFRWVQDGRLWSGGSMANCNNLVAAYALRSSHFARPVAEIAIAMADIGDRPQQY
ncbi:ThiJ/PfpI family protein [Colletotrichum plurivorum]|uniref:ThiJ/PfpI family protein n=1 Tax=Colletotrichum plurivorum TaxID=2175906 RepID=A0A8H6JGP3_9PEZI|nr:ThiJ/PfpI family protein [Colletotrichum plurivorum]